MCNIIARKYTHFTQYEKKEELKNTHQFVSIVVTSKSSERIFKQKSKLEYIAGLDLST